MGGANRSLALPCCRRFFCPNPFKATIPLTVAVGFVSSGSLGGRGRAVEGVPGDQPSFQPVQKRDRNPIFGRGLVGSSCRFTLHHGNELSSRGHQLSQEYGVPTPPFAAAGAVSICQRSDTQRLTLSLPLWNMDAAAFQTDRTNACGKRAFSPLGAAIDDDPQGQES